MRASSEAPFSLTTCPFDDVALVTQHLDNAVAVIALHFDHTIFHGTTAAAGRPELFAQCSDGCIVKRQPT